MALNTQVKNINVTPSSFLMYLRKSRQDDPNETIEEVLSKHETILQEYMEREYGFRIEEENIYREVCSGESIEDREEIKKVLARMESAEIFGVVVVEPQRLSRGDLIDCGNLIQDLRYTHTLVVTPTMTYNLENKMERKFFQDELLRGNDFLEYIKEILSRGKVASIKRGCFIGSKPPYGYDKIKIGKDCTLTPNANADVVRMIFNWYVYDGLSQYEIARKLDEIGIPSCNGTKWARTGVSYTLKNVHYDGKVAFFTHKKTIAIEDGKKKSRYLLQPKEKVIIVEGLHPAIVDHETFVKAQERKSNNLPRTKTKYGLKNPFAGIMYCKVCGRALMLQQYQTGENRIGCKYNCVKSARVQEVFNAVISFLADTELPTLKAKAKEQQTNTYKPKQNILASLEKQLEELNEQEQKQYEFLEKGLYSEEVFEQRNKALKEKRLALKGQIQETMDSIPEQVDYKEKVVFLKNTIKELNDSDIDPITKNKLLKSVVVRIDYYSSKEQNYNERIFNVDVYTSF